MAAQDLLNPNVGPAGLRIDDGRSSLQVELPIDIGQPMQGAWLEQILPHNQIPVAGIGGAQTPRYERWILPAIRGVRAQLRVNGPKPVQGSSERLTALLRDLSHLRFG